MAVLQHMEWGGAYLELLVALGVFREIQISFLPIRHTRADVHQSFSAISSHLRHKNAITMEELLHELRQSYKRRVMTSELLRVANFSELCERSKCLRNMTGVNFSRLRSFKFVVDTDVAWNNQFDVSCCVKLQESKE